MTVRIQRPRLGFLGVGWIGLQRMRAVLESGAAEIVAIADPSDKLRAAALEAAPNARPVSSIEELLALPLDGISIATPSALHAQHALACLAGGRAVFCQKPLARTLAETRTVVDAARAHNRLLEVDFSYRNTAALRALKAVIDSGELGPIYAARLVFHNAYGPDKPWYYDRAASGGGCVMDLGVHLVDSALWLLGERVTRVDSALYAQGKRIEASAVDGSQVEDYATARLELASGASVELACSWKLPVGSDAEIHAEFFGPYGAVRFRNVSGSFYDFVAERMQGTSCRLLAEPPDAWGGRTIVQWVERLAQSADFVPSADRLVEVASVLDRIYGRAVATHAPRSRQNAARDPDALR
jgi:predicted dehydrogenase